MALNPDKSDAILICTVQHAHSDSNLISVNVAGTTVPLASNISIPGILQLYIFKRHSLTQRPITPGPQIQLLIFGALLIHLLTYLGLKSDLACVSDIVRMNRKQSNKKQRYRRPRSELSTTESFTYVFNALANTDIYGRETNDQTTHSAKPECHAGVFDALESAERVM